MKDLKELMAKECNYRFSMDTEIMNRFLNALTEVNLRRGEVLTGYGQLDSNLYIVRAGILRLIYFDGLTEKTFAFATPGTLYTQMHSYSMHLPSVFQVEACINSVVMKISKQKFDAFLAESDEFARWMLDKALDQLCALEMRMNRINGTARERYESLVKTIPEVAGNVSSRIIASYLGITPVYLSRLKKMYSVKHEKAEGQINPITLNSIKSTKP